MINPERYNIWYNKNGCIELESKFNKRSALLDGLTVLIISGRTVLFEKKYQDEELAKKSFLEQIKKYL